jgi:hypothetical protein
LRYVRYRFRRRRTIYFRLYILSRHYPRTNDGSADDYAGSYDDAGGDDYAGSYDDAGGDDDIGSHYDAGGDDY